MTKETDFMNLNSALDAPIVIGSTGSIASGKSTFLSALHSVLWYDKKGIKIDKDRMKGLDEEIAPKAHERAEKGLFRCNATDRPDSMFVYGVSNNNIYPFNFLAPGGHVNAIKIDSNIDGLLYFIDLYLVDFLGDIDAMGEYKLGKWDRKLIVKNGDIIGSIKDDIKDTIEVNYYHPKHVIIDLIRKDAGAPESCDSVDELAKFLAGSYKNMPPFGLPTKKDEGWADRDFFVSYKRELLGEVVQSIIDSHKYAISQLGRDVPVIGVGTHKDKVYNQLPKDKDNLLIAVQSNFNKSISKFAEYQRFHNIEPEDFTLDLVNNIQMQWFFVDLCRQIKMYRGNDQKKIKSYEGYFREVLNPKNKTVLEIAYDIMFKGLQYRGIEPNGFKITTFSEAKSDFTVHYDSLKQ